jgi:hypothetical protein
MNMEDMQRTMLAHVRRSTNRWIAVNAAVTVLNGIAGYVVWFVL